MLNKYKCGNMINKMAVSVFYLFIKKGQVKTEPVFVLKTTLGSGTCRSIFFVVVSFYFVPFDRLYCILTLILCLCGQMCEEFRVGGDPAGGLPSSGLHRGRSGADDALLQ